MGGVVESHRARWAHQRLDFAKGGGDVMPEKLTVDEFLSWQLSIDQFGLAGLRAVHNGAYQEGLNFLTRAQQLPSSCC